MTKPVSITFAARDIETLSLAEGRVAILHEPGTAMSRGARRINRLTRGALARVLESDAFQKSKIGDVTTLAMPVGMSAEALDIVSIPRRAAGYAARKAGAALGKLLGEKGMLILAPSLKPVDQLAQAVSLRAYDYSEHKTAEAKTLGPVTIQCADPETATQSGARALAVAEGVTFTRDLVNAPANFLTTSNFAAQLTAMADLGLRVEVLEEDQLAKLGMNALLAVGQGSDSPSKVVVMEWLGGGDEPPLALVGKGVVFDTGGISLKPAAGMEDMTMDMGGAGTVAGTMRALALRKAKANVVGLVGLVENMPSGNAMRPGDVVTSMKGDTIEVTNTDAEGRLVLCDVMWYAQDRFNPAGMIDLATLTGAIIIGLGHENAGVFSTDDTLCDGLLVAAGVMGEGAWRMPLGAAYAKQLKSRVADVNNTGGRPAGSITAAEFLRRFVKDETPWIHLDIAGVASVKSETQLAPAGATGWGVRTLDQLVRDMFEIEKT